MPESARLCNRCASATRTELARFLHPSWVRGLPVQTRMNEMERVFVFAAARDPERAGDAIQDEAKETRRRRRDD